MKVDYINPQYQFRGHRFNVLQVDVDGEKGRFSREMVEHPGAVVILPFLDNDRIVLIRNYRFVANEYLIELPAGTLEHEEDPYICAFRELEEETGYQAGKMRKLLHFFPSPGFCNEVLHAYVATSLTFKAQKLDPTEQIETLIVSFEDSLRMIAEGTIKDAKTITTILYYHQFT